MSGRKNVHEQYVNLRKSMNDVVWQNIEKPLYYSVKNKRCIVPLILWISFFVLCGAFGVALCGCLYAWWWCQNNNEKLDNNVEIVKLRAKYMHIFLEDARKKMGMESVENKNVAKN